MAGIVGPALAQEGVSGLSSYISSKLEEKASREHILARLKMALSRIEFGLEKTRKMPITSVALLRRRKDIERAYSKGTRLLNKHKLQVVLIDELEQNNLKEEKDMGQAMVTQSSFPFFLERIFEHARNFTAFLPKTRNFTISSLLSLSKEEYLSSSVVQNYEWYADCVDNFLRDVEFGCPLRQGTSRYPLIRHLLEGKTLWYEMVKKGSHLLLFYIWPVIVEGRGIEVELYFHYVDCRMPEKSFALNLAQRLSEDTDIIGIAIKCMQRLTSHFNLVVESAIGEFTLLLPNLQDIPHHYGPPSCCVEVNYVSFTKWCREDPICCNENSCGTLANKSSINVPEQVIDFDFGCYLSAPEYKSTDGVGENNNAPLLFLRAYVAPHLSCTFQDITLEYGGKEEIKNGSTTIEEMQEMVTSNNALDYLVHEPEPTGYALCWYSAHGAAVITLCKTSHQRTWPKPMAVPRPGRRASKRKRQKVQV